MAEKIALKMYEKQKEFSKPLKKLSVRMHLQKEKSELFLIAVNRNRVEQNSYLKKIFRI